MGKGFLSLVEFRRWSCHEARPGSRAGVAQLVEQLTCNQQVDGSNPPASSSGMVLRRRRVRLRRRLRPPAQAEWFCAGGASAFGGDSARQLRKKVDVSSRSCRAIDERRYGQVAKWLNATDCKSVGISLRRFESFPAHATIDNCQRTTDNGQRMEMERRCGCRFLTERLVDWKRDAERIRFAQRHPLTIVD
jgi:hypothetical protein